MLLIIICSLLVTLSEGISCYEGNYTSSLQIKHDCKYCEYNGTSINPLLPGCKSERTGIIKRCLQELPPSRYFYGNNIFVDRNGCLGSKTKCGRWAYAICQWDNCNDLCRGYFDITATTTASTTTEEQRITSATLQLVTETPPFINATTTQMTETFTATNVCHCPTSGVPNSITPFNTFLFSLIITNLKKFRHF